VCLVRLVERGFVALVWVLGRKVLVDRVQRIQVSEFVTKKEENREKKKRRKSRKKR